MEEFYVRFIIVFLIIATIVVLKLISLQNKRNISSGFKVDREIMPLWQPGKEAIMFFMSDNCVECEKLQKPALKNLQTKNTPVYTINAAEEFELANYFRVLTVPTTIIVDNQGVPKFINQGYTSEKILAEQLGRI